VAVIPAPVVPIPANKQYGKPSWVKVIKTSTHSANDVVLEDLVSDDSDADGLEDWQNGEPAEVETEFKLLQTNNDGNDAKDELQGAADDMGDGSENVTRRYEFYEYGAAANTIDGENGEAMCDEVNPTTDPDDPLYLHGVGTNVEVTNWNGDPTYVNCESQVVVGDYVGAQMAGFDAALALGLVNHLQDGEKDVDYVPRNVVVGGSTPYAIAPTAGLPPGMTIGDDGVLSGTPGSGGVFNFTVEATDADDTTVIGDFSLAIAGEVVVPQYVLTVQRQGAGSVTGGGIDCGVACDVTVNSGTEVTLNATADPGNTFTGWGGACAGSGACVVTLGADTTVTANFAKIPPPGGC
jgi:hypothetical protein